MTGGVTGDGNPGLGSDLCSWAALLYNHSRGVRPSPSPTSGLAPLSRDTGDDAL